MKCDSWFNCTRWEMLVMLIGHHKHDYTLGFSEGVWIGWNRHARFNRIVLRIPRL
jgi:hypothetical protein